MGRTGDETSTPHRPLLALANARSQKHFVGIRVSIAAPPAPGYTRLFEGAIGSFVSEYPPQDPRPVHNAPLAGPLDIGPHVADYYIFLPTMLKSYVGWWPQSLP